MITDNTLIAFECLHALRNGNHRCKQFGAYKLDITKAYDHVDWGFLEGVLQRLGFHSTWVQWIMACVTRAKEVLIKSVTQAIPTYVMGVFKLPGNLGEELN
jgi:hypothetical protein